MWRLACAVAFALAIAGCASPGGPTNPDMPQVTTTSSSASESTAPPPPEDDNAVFIVSFEAAGESTLEVPFPTIDSCRSPEDWMAGTVAKENATAEVRDVSGNRTGRVIAVTGQGKVTWSSQITPGPRCETLRHDPWTIDPDPEGEDRGNAVEVRASDWMPAQATVMVRLVRDHCGNATMYQGIPGNDWGPLEGRTMPASCD